MCHLDPSTGKYLLKDGPWRTIELDIAKEEDAWMLFPHVYGRLVLGAKDEAFEGFFFLALLESFLSIVGSCSVTLCRYMCSIGLVHRTNSSAAP